MALCIYQVGYMEAIKGHILPSSVSNDEWELVPKSNPITIVFLGLGA
jgi:hypothetical protein